MTENYHVRFCSGGGSGDALTYRNPTPSQRQVLARTDLLCAFVYNWALALRRDAYRERGERVYYRDTSAALTRLKQQPEFGWLHETSSVPPQQALRHLDKAFRTFFDGRAKYPTFKKKRGRQSAEDTRLCLRLGWKRFDPGAHAGNAAHSLESSAA